MTPIIFTSRSGDPAGPRSLPAARRPHQGRRLRAAAGAATLAVVAGWVPAIVAGPGPASGSAPAGWATGWTTSQQSLAETAISNATVRLIARVTVPGDSIRIRLDNTFGQEPVRIGRASVGARVQGALVAAGSSKPITFSQAAEVT